MNIMIVEDDRALSSGIVLALSNPEDTFLKCYTIKEAKACYMEQKVDMIVLDINLPDGNGYEILQMVRKESELPVLILTANDLELDEVTGLSMGADDYVTKPFSLAVLRARLEALKRRARKTGQPDIYEIGDLRLDFKKLLFYRGTEELALSRNEQKLLRLFVENRGRVLTRELLMERLWTDGAEFVDENALSVTMNRLRRKLEEDIKNPRYIQTVYGQGYIWRKEL